MILNSRRHVNQQKVCWENVEKGMLPFSFCINVKIYTSFFSLQELWHASLKGMLVVFVVSCIYQLFVGNPRII